MTTEIVQIQIGVHTDGTVCLNAVRVEGGDALRLRFLTPEDALTMADHIAQSASDWLSSRDLGVIAARLRDAAEAARALRAGAWNGKVANA